MMTVVMCLIADSEATCARRSVSSTCISFHNQFIFDGSPSSNSSQDFCLQLVLSILLLLVFFLNCKTNFSCVRTTNVSAVDEKGRLMLTIRSIIHCQQISAEVEGDDESLASSHLSEYTHSTIW